MISRVSRMGSALARQNKVLVNVIAVGFAALVSTLSLNLFLALFGMPLGSLSLDGLRLEILVFVIYNVAYLVFTRRRKALLVLAIVACVLFPVVAYNPAAQLGLLYYLREYLVLIVWPFLNVFFLNSFIEYVNRRRPQVGA